MIRIPPHRAEFVSTPLICCRATQGGMGRAAEIESRPNYERFVQSSYSSLLLGDRHEPAAVRAQVDAGERRSAACKRGRDDAQR